VALITLKAYLKQEPYEAMDIRIRTPYRGRLSYLKMKYTSAPAFVQEFFQEATSK